MFDLTTGEVNKGVLLLMALPTYVSLIYRLFSLPFPDLILGGLVMARELK